MSDIIISVHQGSDLQLTESADPKFPGFKMAKGTFGTCDVPTKNGRVYRKALVEREVDGLQDKIGRRALYGELDHPKDGETRFERVSHIITKLEVQDDGRVYGEAVILRTPRGQILEAVIEAGGEVGISSRGKGSLKMEGGQRVVDEDFSLKSYDFVVENASEGAVPVISESVDEFEFTPEVVEANFPDLWESMLSKIGAGAPKGAVEGDAGSGDAIDPDVFREALAESVEQMRSEVRESLREEMESDPANVSAAAFLEEIHRATRSYFGESSADEQAVADALAAASAREAELGESLADVTSKLNQTTYALYVEQQIGVHGAGDADAMRTMIGEFDGSESLDDVKKSVATVVDRFEVLREKRDELDREREALAESAGRDRDALMSRELEAALSLVSELREGLKAKADECAALRGQLSEAAAVQASLDKMTERAESLELFKKGASKLMEMRGDGGLISLVESATTDADLSNAIAEAVSGMLTRPAETRESVQARLRKGYSESDVETLQESGDGAVAAPTASRAGVGGGAEGVARITGQSIEQMARLTSRG